MKKRVIAATIGGLGLALVVPQVAHSAAARHSNEVTYTLAQVAQHKTAADCWSAVSHGVYDLTNWLPRHPQFAGSVATICGVDATAFFVSTKVDSRPVVIGHEDGEDDSQGNDDRHADRAVTAAKVVQTAHRDGGAMNHGHRLAKSIRPYRIGRLVDVTPTAVVAPSPSVTVTPPGSPTVTTFTLAQVATHTTIGDCWTAIGGNVYNLSDWASSHPGGSAALLSFICGKDGTKAFAHQHGGSSKPASILSTRKVGVLA